MAKQPTPPTPQSQDKSSSAGVETTAATAPVPTLRSCPRCFRTEPELGSEFCGNFALGCPQPVSLSAEEAVTLKCGPCGKTLTVPIGNIMQRKHLDELGTCVSDQCHARAISLTPAQAIARFASVPPPLSGD